MLDEIFKKYFENVEKEMRIANEQSELRNKIKNYFKAYFNEITFYTPTIFISDYEIIINFDEDAISTDKLEDICGEISATVSTGYGIGFKIDLRQIYDL